MSKPTVTLTLAGDTAQLEKAFDRVGSSSKDMAAKVGEAGAGFDKAGEASDRFEQRAMGFRDTITGAQDSVKGFGAILKGDFSGEALLLAGMGVGDLASGFANLLIPMAKSMATTVAHTTAMVAHATWSGIVRGATLAWTGAQWLLNVALTANPIGLIIAAIVILVGIVVLIATKTTWFQTVWKVVWTFVKDKAVAVWNWIKELPGKFKTVFEKIGGFISAPFRAAFNKVSDFWNGTVGRLSWSVPGWVPVIGGKSISAPQLPRFHSGGVVPGPRGREMLAVLQGGERVTPAGGGATVIEIRSGGSRMDDLLVEILARAIAARGGSAQAVLGR